MMHKKRNSQSKANFDNHWVQRWWRPLMALQYMIVCLFDFLVAPILWTLVQIKFQGNATTQWMPITLQGAGLYHLAMGAVLGIAAYGRTQEKLNGTSGWNSYSNPSPSTVGYGASNYGAMTNTPQYPAPDYGSSAQTSYSDPTQTSQPSFNAKGQKVVPLAPDMPI